ncbi:hypothetical protein EYC80_002852 [Monilinia laxa]|uniref:Uncharacterized protein n=1 Tax=Monilinia laxa TaxID=61186 RepID=A0A5N6KC06_MONLA|nr:hypothetical protein EYC80_002852 [Monilinia laxa]
MVSPTDELRTVHEDRLTNIGKLVDGKWIWPTVFTSHSSDQQSNEPSPTSYNQSISEEPTTNPNNIEAPESCNNSLDNLHPTMNEGSRVQGGLQQLDSQRSSSSETTKSNQSSRSGSYLFSSIETLASPSALPSLSLSPAPTRTPGRALSEVNALDFATTASVRDHSFMYASGSASPEASSTEGRTLEDAKLGSDINTAGDSPTSLISKKRAVKYALHKTPDYLEVNDESQLYPNKAQTHIEKAEHHRKARLGKVQEVINKPAGFAEVEGVPRAKRPNKYENSQPYQVNEVTSSEQVHAPTKSPELRLPQKPKTPAEMSDHQLPPTYPQAFEPMIIDTLQERYQKDEARASTQGHHRSTPPAIRAYRERYLPSIRTASSSNQSKIAAVGTEFQSSTTNTGPVFSVLPSVGLLATEGFALPRAEPQDELMLSAHPSVTASFQTPGAIPYNLTPSPVSSDRGNSFYEPYGHRSSSPFDNGYNMADVPPISVTEVVSIPTNEATPTRAASFPSIRRVHRSDTPSIEETQNASDCANPSSSANHATSRSFRPNNFNTQALADKEIGYAFDLTRSPTPSPGPDIRKPIPSPIDLTYSPSPLPESNLHQSVDLTGSPTHTQELDDLPQEHHSQTRDGRAPSPPERFDSVSKETVSAESIHGSSEEIDNDFNPAELFYSQASEVAAPPGPGQPADDEFIQDKAAHNERRLTPPISSAQAGTVVDAISSADAKESFGIAASSGGDAMEIDAPAEVEKSLKVAKPVENSTMDIDEGLSSDLSEVQSDSELDVMEARTKKLLETKKLEQALINKLTGPTLPHGTYLPWAPHLAPPLSTIGYDEYEFAKEGEYFDLAYVLFRTVPKRVFDKIWIDEHYRPEISLSTGPPKWVRPRDPTIEHAAKADPNSFELVKVLSAVEKSLLQIWIDVESAVLMLYAEFDNEFRAKDLTVFFRQHQLSIYTEWKRLYVHLVTLADWKERYFAASNVKKRALPNNVNPYKHLFTTKNSAGILFYGTREYFNAMKAAIKDAWDAFDCAEMKQPKYKQLRRMNKTALGEEFFNCLDGLRGFHSVVRRRDWEVEAYSEDEASSEDELPPPMIGLEQSKEGTSKGKGKGVAAEDDSEERSDDVSDGDPPSYYEEADDDDGDYFEDDSHHPCGGSQSVQSPTCGMKRGATHSSRRISFDDEMTANKGGELQLQTRRSLNSGAGYVQSPKVTGVRKGAKRLMVEVSDGSSPQGVEKYFETP